MPSFSPKILLHSDVHTKSRIVAKGVGRRQQITRRIDLHSHFAIDCEILELEGP